MRCVFLVLAVFLMGCSGVREQVGVVGQNLWGAGSRALGPRDFPGVAPEARGPWEVEGWEVRAARAWVERSGGKVVRLYAEGSVDARGAEARVFGNWISIERGGVPVVAECRQVIAQGKHYAAKDGPFRYEYSGGGKMRFLGTVVTQAGWSPP